MIIGQKFRWIQGGSSDGDNYCEGAIVGVVRKGDSLFENWPRRTFKWADYIKDRSVRYDRAVLRNLKHDPENRSSKPYLTVAMEKLSQPIKPERRKIATAQVITQEKTKNKYLRRPGLAND